MLKSLAILAVLFSFVQTPAPIPRQASKGSTQDSHNAEKNSPKNPPPPAVQPAVMPPNTLSQQVRGEAKSSNDDPQAVSIRELPTVSVSKGWEDWLLWAAQIVLVIVGIFGIFYARHSLRILRQQVKEMSRQNKNILNAERAWVVVSVKEITPGEYIFIATNEGKTPAKVESAYCDNIWTPRSATLDIPADDKTDKRTLQNPPFLLPPRATKMIFRCSRTEIETISGGGAGMQSNFARGFGVANMYGRIRYHNVLDIKSVVLHETRFLYLLIPLPGTIPMPDPMHPEHNTYT